MIIITIICSILAYANWEKAKAYQSRGQIGYAQGGRLLAILMAGMAILSVIDPTALQ